MQRAGLEDVLQRGNLSGDRMRQRRCVGAGAHEVQAAQQLVAAQPQVERHVNDAGAEAGVLEHDVIVGQGQGSGEEVALAEPQTNERPGRGQRAVAQLAVGHRRARVAFRMAGAWGCRRAHTSTAACSSCRCAKRAWKSSHVQACTVIFDIIYEQ